MADTKRLKWGEPLASLDIPVAAAVTIYLGDLVVRNAAGYAERRTSATLVAADQFVGVATAQVDNSDGAAGDLKVPVDFGRRYRFPNSTTDPVLAAHRQCYLEDYTTVCAFRDDGDTINVPGGMVVYADSSVVDFIVGIASQWDILSRIEVLEGY